MAEGNGKSLFGLPLNAWLPVVVIVVAGGVAWGAQTARMDTVEKAVEKIANKVDRLTEDTATIKGELQRARRERDSYR